VKAHRFITHVKRLKHTGDSLKTFLDAAIVLGEKLGPLLFQLPSNLAFDECVAGEFCSLLPKGHRYVLEARHES
jgi:uncharacterized protein YecE (DUF72 family)